MTFLQESLSARKDIAWGSSCARRWTRSLESVPDGPVPQTSCDLGTGAAAIAPHSLDLASGFPVQDYLYDDAVHNNNDTVDIPT